MGHIALVSPVTNILLFKVLATNLSKLLEIPVKSLEDIIYFRTYVVIDNGLTTLLKKKELLEKKIDLNLVKSIFQEIVEDKDLAKSVVDKAKKIVEEITEKGNSKELELNAAFLEDYFDFLENHRK